jgi:hypothetical protein
MPVLILRAVAWAAQNAAVPVLEWLLAGAGRAIERHEAARAKKKGPTPPK